VKKQTIVNYTIGVMAVIFSVVLIMWVGSSLMKLVALMTDRQPRSEVVLKGFCVENDKGVEIYKTSHDLQIKAFENVHNDCVFSGVRQDLLGCLGDDFYSYRCPMI